MRQMLSVILFSFSGMVMAQSPEPSAVKTPTAAYAGVDISGMLGAFVLVLGCLFVVSWFLRRSRLVSAPNQAGVNVIAQLPLNMKEKLLVVQVGEERLLLGATPGCIRTLHSWKAEALPPPAAQESFASVLGGSVLGSKLAKLKAKGNENKASVS